MAKEATYTSAFRTGVVSASEPVRDRPTIRPAPAMVSHIMAIPVLAKATGGLPLAGLAVAA